jgi:hypothetical protein
VRAPKEEARCLDNMPRKLRIGRRAKSVLSKTGQGCDVVY